MRVRSKKGAAMAYTIIVSVFLFILAAAVLSIASGMTNFVRNGTDQKISYLDAKSAIEYAKAVLSYKMTNGETLGDFYVSGTPNTDGSIAFTYADGASPGGSSVYAVCTFDTLAGSLTIKSDTSRLGYQGDSLTYTTTYTSTESGTGGLDTPPEEYVQVGPQMGDFVLVNGDNHLCYSDSYIPYPAVFKHTVILTGNQGGGATNQLKTEGMYFMGEPSLDSTAGTVYLYSKVFYFNGNLTGESNKKGEKSNLNLIPLTTGSTAYLYFDNVTVTIGSQTRNLNGFYSINGQVDLFSSSPAMTPITNQAGIDAAKSQFSAYLFGATNAKLATMISGDEEGWLHTGEIKYSASTNYYSEPGKTVFMYVNDVKDLPKYSSLSYSAEMIIVDSVAGSWSVGDNKGATALSFTAPYLSFNMNGAAFVQGNAGSSFIINHPSGVTAQVIVKFAANTEFRSSSGSVINLVSAGTYLCPSGTNFFAPGVNSKLTIYTGTGGSGSGGTGGTSGSTVTTFGDAVYIR